METVLNKIKRNTYRNADPYPLYLVKPIPVFTVDNARAKELHDYATMLEAWERAVDEMQRGRGEWFQNNTKLENQFRADLEEETGMVGHPKANVLYIKAREIGNRNGIDGIYSAYMELLELVQ